MSSSNETPRRLDRYLLFDKIASGGMATVHLGRLMGDAGFTRTVAIKRMNAELARHRDFVTMFLDEARLAARIRHPNVVSTIDVVRQGPELFLVMDYVHGEALSSLLRAVRRAGEIVPPNVASAVLVHGLLGLHAAHEATADSGEPLRLVHRDFSPQNVLVGTDGVARVVDFGVAKAAARHYQTREGQLKGKFSYMAPEQIQEGTVDRRSDVFAAGAVLWETLTGKRLFPGTDMMEIIKAIIHCRVEPPTELLPGLPKAVDEVVLRALAAEPDDRFPTARAMATALQEALPPAPTLEVGDWVGACAPDTLAERAALVARAERQSASGAQQAGPPSISLFAESAPALDAAAAPPTVPENRGRVTRMDGSRLAAKPIAAQTAGQEVSVPATVVVGLDRAQDAPAAVAQRPAPAPERATASPAREAPPAPAKAVEGGKRTFVGLGGGEPEAAVPASPADAARAGKQTLVGVGPGASTGQAAPRRHAAGERTLAVAERPAGSAPATAKRTGPPVAVETVSAAARPARAAPAQRRRIALAAIAVLGVALFVLLVVAPSGDDGESARGAGATAHPTARADEAIAAGGRATPDEAVAATAAGGSPVSAAADTAETSRDDETSVSATSATAATVTRAMPNTAATPSTSQRPAKGGSSAKPAPTKPPQGNCNPPYVIRPDGVKVYKEECFR